MTNGAAKLRRAFATMLCLIAVAITPDALSQGFRDVTADTWLEESDGNQNHGADKTLSVRTAASNSKRSIYKYDLSGVAANANVTVAEAWFWVTDADASGNPVNIYRVTDSWAENSATWNNTASDYDASTVVASFVPTGTGWQKIDIAPLAQSWVCQEFDDYGLMLIATSSDTESQYNSKEANNKGQRPRLKFTTSGTNSCITGVDHFVIVHDTYGIHCLAEIITVRAEDALANPVSTYSQQVTLDTQTGDGTWALVTGSGTFADATADDGLATYQWAAGESEAVFSLSYTQGIPSIDIDVYQTDDDLIRDDDTEGNIVFSASGFTVTAAALGNPPPGIIVPFDATQAAGTDFGLYLSAYGQTPNDPVCGVIESYTGPQNLKLWFTRDDPATGAVAVSVDAATIADNEAVAASQAVNFTNGQAAVTAKYKDAGRVLIAVKDDSLLHPDLPNGIRGSTASFPVKPFRFALSNIEDGGGTPNPGAADATGPVFVAAGRAFSVTVTALDAEGDVTPNYGQEATPESVRLQSALVAPAGGNNPGITPLLGFGPFSDGSAVGNAFAWHEVGVITLLPSVADADYLGGGDVTGTVSGNVGRFIPDHFTTAVNAPQFSTQCASGSFTYSGQSFGYTVPPVIAFNAVSVGGAVTRNYTGSFFKVSNTTLQNRNYGVATGALDISGLPAVAVDPVVADTGAGSGTLTFSAGTGLAFLRALPVAPFDADISLGVDLIDADIVTALSNPVTVASIGFDSGPSIRFGRVRLVNALGSELVNLAVPMRAEYFIDTSSGFGTHTDDSCTAAVTLSLGSFTANLQAGETCVLDSGSPGSSGAGCAAPGPAGQSYREPPLGGDFNLFLQAPGAGNDGSTVVTGDVPPWLEFDWDAALPGLEDPSAIATFGIYDGDGKRIYTRELY